MLTVRNHEVDAQFPPVLSI